MAEAIPAAPGKALQFIGDVGKGQFMPGVPAQDLTAEQVKTWLTADQYQAALDSGWYQPPAPPAAKDDK